MCKKKNFVRALLVVLLIILVGCENGLEYLNETLSSNNTLDNDNSNVENDNSMNDYSLSPSYTISHPIHSENSNQLLLIDILTNNVLVESEEFGYVLLEVFPLSNGYWGAFGRGSEPEEGWDLDDWLLWEEADVKFFVFNESLELVEQFEITDPELLQQRNRATFNYESGNLVFYFNDWSVWGEEGIYQYNATSHEKTLVLKNNEFSFWNLQHIDESQLLFTGSRMGVETHYYYGTIHLSTGEIQYNSINFQPEAIIIEGNYALITEHPTGFLQGDAIGFSYRSEVAVLNLKTGESRVVQLEDEESRQAIVVNDTYILTGNCMVIRLYDINTGEIVREQQVSNFPELERCLEEVFPFVYKYRIVNDAQFAVVFQTAEGVFHTEVFSIEE